MPSIAAENASESIRVYHCALSGSQQGAELLREPVRKEESRHLETRVRTPGIGVRSGCASTRPRVSCAVYAPSFENVTSGRVGVYRFRKRPPARALRSFRTLRKGRRGKIVGETLGITFVHFRIAIAVKDDRRDR